MRRFVSPSVPGFVVLLAPLGSAGRDGLISSRDGCISGHLAVLRPVPPLAAGTPAGFLVQA